MKRRNLNNPKKFSFVADASKTHEFLKPFGFIATSLALSLSSVAIAQGAPQANQTPVVNLEINKQGGDEDKSNEFQIKWQEITSTGENGASTKIYAPADSGSDAPPPLD